MQYSIPNAIDAVACCFMNFVASGMRLFGSESCFTRCQEVVAEKEYLTMGYLNDVSTPNRIYIQELHGEGMQDRFRIGVLRTF